MYDSAKPGPGGSGGLVLTPLELIERIAALVPPPRKHRHRYFGVLAPNSPMRAAVTAMATPEEQRAVPAPAKFNSAQEPVHRSTARYLWAMLLARIHEAFPLLCPVCGAHIRIIAFINDAPTVRHILTHIGEPFNPPQDFPRSWPTAVGGGRFRSGWQRPQRDPSAQPQPAYEFDQRIAW
jgi:hypothetical protein